MFGKSFLYVCCILLVALGGCSGSGKTAIDSDPTGGSGILRSVADNGPSEWGQVGANGQRQRRVDSYAGPTSNRFKWLGQAVGLHHVGCRDVVVGDEGTIYFHWGPQALAAMDPTDGSVVWVRDDLPGFSPVERQNSTPAVCHNGYVCHLEPEFDAEADPPQYDSWFAAYMPDGQGPFSWSVPGYEAVSPLVIGDSFANERMYVVTDESVTSGWGVVDPQVYIFKWTSSNDVDYPTLDTTWNVFANVAWPPESKARVLPATLVETQVGDWIAIAAYAYSIDLGVTTLHVWLELHVVGNPRAFYATHLQYSNEILFSREMTADSQGRLYISTNQALHCVFNMYQLLWDFAPPQIQGYEFRGVSSPAVMLDDPLEETEMLYVTAGQGDGANGFSLLYGVRASDGALLYTSYYYPGAIDPSSGSANPSIDGDDNVYVPAYGALYCEHLSSHVRWTMEPTYTPGQVYSPVFGPQGDVYAAGNTVGSSYRLVAFEEWWP